MIITTEAVILKTMKYSESSRIVTLYTRDRGRVSAIAKGARGPRTRFGSSLHPMSYVKGVLYIKETRDLQLLSQCEHVQVFRALSEDLDKMSGGMAIVELVAAVTHGEEQNLPLFDLLVNSLRAIENATKSSDFALYYFEMSLLDALGFKPEVHRCAMCGNDLGAMIDEGSTGFQMGQSGVLCPTCAARGLGFERLSPPAVRILQRLQDIREPEAATRIQANDAVRAEIATAIRRHLRRHVENLHDLKSEQVFSSINHNPGRL